MGKVAWDDSHKYNVKLTAREMRIISACLDCSRAILASGVIPHFSKINDNTLRKLEKDFEVYGSQYFCFGLYPDKIGRRAERIKPPIDKP